MDNFGHMSSELITVPVPLSGRPYDVLVGKGLLTQAGKLAKTVLSPRRCAVITDNVVGPLHSTALIHSLVEAGYEPHLLTIPATETSKSLGEASKLCDQLIELGLDRKSAIFALGGGVVGDLAGFVASIYFRGIPLIQIPTTVVAQVDSSIGGKTGVNSPLGKNLVGTFLQPRLVITDTDTLKTLDDSIFREGFAEVIKHAVIADADMLQALPPKREGNLCSLIAQNVGIKARIVAEDEFETKGTRALLNFGHTIGHAIESVAGYGVLAHGEAVSIGMIAALDLSVRLAGLPESESDRVTEVIAACDLPTSIPESLATEDIIAVLRHDKKFDCGAIRFVLTKKLGSAFVSNRVTIDEISGVIRRLKKASAQGMA